MGYILLLFVLFIVIVVIFRSFLAAFIIFGVAVTGLLLFRRYKAKKAAEEEYYKQKAQQERDEALKGEREKAREAAARRLKEVGERFNKLLSSIPACEIVQDPEAKRKNKKDCERSDVAMSNVTKSSDISRLGNFIVVDTETTGLSARQDQIVELTAVKFESWEPVEMFTTLINPGIPIPEEASSIHGITDEMVKDAPKIAAVIKSFDEFIGKKNLVGHNLPFDLGFLDYAGSEYFSVQRMYYDTLYLAKLLDLNVSNNKLTTLCEYYSIRDNSTAHRSASDALATGILFQKLVDLKTV